MNFMVRLIQWFTDPANWTGPNGIPVRVAQHVELSVIGICLAIAIALPVGLLIGHTRKREFLASSIANAGRAIPSFAVLVIVFIFMVQYAPALSFGIGPTVVALTLLAIPPILTNAYVGIQTVDADAVDAARGMGLSGRGVLFGLELPLAAPLVVAGIRTGAVQVVATATLAALIGGGGLGRYIVDGLAQGNYPMMVAGAILVAALALITEASLGWVGRRVEPHTSSVGAPPRGPGRRSIRSAGG